MIRPRSMRVDPKLAEIIELHRKQMIEREAQARRYNRDISMREAGADLASKWEKEYYEMLRKKKRAEK